MAEALMYDSEQVAVFDPTDTLSKERMAVESVILRGSAAGTFVFVLGNTTFTITTGSAFTTKQFTINRSVNYAELSSGPTSAKMYLMLESKP